MREIGESRQGLRFLASLLSHKRAMLYFTLYYAMTGLHALHVLIGIGLFAWTIRRLRRGLETSAAHAWLEHTGLYWHFVDIVWLFLWPMFYLLH